MCGDMKVLIAWTALAADLTLLGNSTVKGYFITKLVIKGMIENQKKLNTKEKEIVPSY